MGVPQRTNRYIGLKDLDILIEDNQPDSKYFRVLECPTIFTQNFQFLWVPKDLIMKRKFVIEIFNKYRNKI